MSDPYRAADSPFRDGDAGGLCPRCTDVLLRPLSFGAARVLACSTCGGVFADRAMLEQVTGGETAALRALADEATRAPPRPKTLPKVLACPRCQTAMKPIYVKAARCEIDVCHAHGVWFDRWEAQLVLEAARDPAIARALRSSLR